VTRAAAYFDTSVLLKRYVREAGSDRAQELLRRCLVVTSAIAPVEMLSALTRRRRAGDLDDADFKAIVGQLARDRQRWHLVEVTAEVLGRAEAVIERAHVRALDAIHLASAMAVDAALNDPARRLPFVTVDDRQQAGAQALGMPNAEAGG
jgi:predicted nucleic acid-binding protein